MHTELLIQVARDVDAGQGKKMACILHELSWDRISYGYMWIKILISSCSECHKGRNNMELGRPINVRQRPKESAL